MSVNNEIMLKVAKALNNEETAEKVNQATKLEDAYNIVCGNMEEVSLEDFKQVLLELKESDGKIELSEDDLEVVAGGLDAESGYYIGTGVTFKF